jgi:hypothetical protein
MSKKAIVTGASEGIGRVFARKLAEAGYAVTAVARTDHRLRDLVSGLPGSGHSFFTADLSKPEDLASAASRIQSEGYSLLVNNAGFGIFGKFHEVPLEKLRQMSRLNCDAVTALTHAFLKTAKQGDALLNVASTAAFHPMPGNGLYAATKAFVLSLTESLWHEQRARGVYVGALCPGYTLTEFSKRAGSEDNASFKKFAQTPDEVVDVALAGLESRSTPIIVPGFQNNMLVLLQRALPRKAAAEIAGRAMEKFLNGSGGTGLSSA